jgi:hypothetical protein
MQLDPTARAYLANLQHQTGPIDATLEDAIAQACAQAGRALTVNELQKTIEQALPNTPRAQQLAKVIKGPGQERQQGDCNDCQAFPTRIFELKIKKENALPYAPPVQIAPVRRDPLFAAFNLSPEADVMLLFNARDVDRNGRPLLLKIVAREGVDLERFDLGNYRTRDGWKRDVVTVKANADVVRIEDKDETEFAFGDPLKQLSLDAKGRQISTSVMLCRDNEQVDTYYRARLVGGRYEMDLNAVQNRQVQNGEQLDRQAVMSFPERIQIDLRAPDGAGLGWLDANAKDYGITIDLERGLIFEPNAKADVTFINKNVSTSVPADDAELLGSPKARVGEIQANMTLEQLLRRTLRLRTYTLSKEGAAKADLETKDIPVVDLVYAQPKSIQLGGKDLAPLTSTLAERGKLGELLIAAEKRPLAKDPECDGQKIDLTLEPGFLKGESIAGWRVVVGYTDVGGAWKTVDERRVKGNASACERFSLDLDNAPAIHQARRSLEVRVYNDRGVPAQRVVVPFEVIDWAPGLRRG